MTTLDLRASLEHILDNRLAPESHVDRGLWLVHNASALRTALKTAKDCEIMGATLTDCQGKLTARLEQVRELTSALRRALGALRGLQRSLVEVNALVLELEQLVESREAP